MFNQGLLKYEDPLAKFLIKNHFSSKPFVKQYSTKIPTWFCSLCDM